jgi:glycosyltransferase involved in cell wall biosynthesis
LPGLKGAEFFPPTDIGAMSKTIETVVYSDDRRNVLISKGHDRLKEFSWQKCAEQTLAVYQGLQG